MLKYYVLNIPHNVVKNFLYQKQRGRGRGGRAREEVWDREIMFSQLVFLRGGQRIIAVFSHRKYIRSEKRRT